MKLEARREGSELRVTGSGFTPPFAMLRAKWVRQDNDDSRSETYSARVVDEAVNAERIKAGAPALEAGTIDYSVPYYEDYLGVIECGGERVRVGG